MADWLTGSAVRDMPKEIVRLGPQATVEGGTTKERTLGRHCSLLRADRERLLGLVKELEKHKCSGSCHHHALAKAECSFRVEARACLAAQDQ